MTTVSYYQNPVQLLRRAGLALKRSPVLDDFRYAAGLNTAILGAVELVPASHDYPIVFAPGQDGRLMPQALLGVREGENLFVDAVGRWQPGCYLPAYVRRYPFIPARRDSGELDVCVDDRCLSESGAEGEVLFDAAGEATPLLGQILALLSDFDHQARLAEAFARRLDALGLLVERAVRLDMRNGQSWAVDGFRVVDEVRLDALDDKTWLELRAGGHIKLVMAHLMSLRNLGGLPDRLAPRLELGVEPGDAAAPAEADGEPRARSKDGAAPPKALH